MKSNSIVAPIALAVIASISIQPAAAASSDEKQFTVRVGTSYSKLKDPTLFGDTDAKLSSDVTWNISAAWRPLEHWGAEIIYIHNADYDIDITPNKSLKAYGVAGFEAQASNVYLNWYPFAKNSSLQPYLGIGANYTKYGNANLTDLGKKAIGSDDLQLKISNTFGPSVQFGVDYNLSNNLLLNAAVSYTDSSSDWTAFERNTKPNKDSGVSLNPWTINLGIGYTF